MDYSIKNGVLTLKAKGNNKNNINYSERAYIKIYVPESSEFTTIDCEGDVGDIHIGKIKVDNMAINTAVEK